MSRVDQWTVQVGRETPHVFESEGAAWRHAAFTAWSDRATVVRHEGTMDEWVMVRRKPGSRVGIVIGLD